MALADASVLVVADFNKICRLCLETEDTSFHSLSVRNEKLGLRQKVTKVIGLECSNSDGMPNQICSKCNSIVEAAYNLQITAEHAHKLLSSATVLRHCEDNELEEDRETKCNDIVDPKILADDTTGFDKIDKERIIKESSDNKRVPKNLTCQICLVSFTSEDQVSTHVLSHYVDTTLTPYMEVSKPYSCEDCGEQKLSKLKLIQHHRMHLGVNPFVCQYEGCSYVGKDMTTFRHHLIVHSSRDQVCSDCGATFKRRWEVKLHERRVHSAPAQPLACPECHVVSKNEVALRAHLNSHKLGKRFPCTVPECGKRYTRRSDLTAHERSHAGARCYRCPLCHVAAYTSQSLLNRHLRMHERRRVWACDKCTTSFADYGAYYAHRVQGHGVWRPLRCTRCQRSYKDPEHLEQHKLTCKCGRESQPDLDELSAEHEPTQQSIET